MVIVLKPWATERNREDVVENIKGRGYGVHVSVGETQTIIGVIGISPEEKVPLADQYDALPFVDKCVFISKPYKVVDKAFRPEGTTINVRGIVIGGEKAVMMAGPCTVETEEQIMESARLVKAAGAHILRGGAYKPSTSPYSFHGHGVDALKMLAQARAETGMPIITEVMDVRDVETVCEYADILQIGTRNAQNYNLLREVGKVRTPVMLKRGMSSKLEEWLQAAEYIADQGNYNIMLCERGIRTFETYTRNTFDINAIPALKELTHLPVVADPSHGTGESVAGRRRHPRRVCRRCGRRHCRSAPAPGKGPEGRRSIPDAESLCRTDGKPEETRPDCRPDIVSGAIPVLAIIGTGLIGGSIGLAAKARGRVPMPGMGGAEIVAIEENETARSVALERGAADRAVSSLAEGLKGASLVVLAVPVPTILRLLPELPALLAPDAIVTDVGSVKTPIAEAGRAVLGDHFVPGHPMAGSEKHGMGAARPDLFQNATWAITPLTGAAREPIERVAQFAAGLGANVLELPPTEHDRAVAVTSHIPHLLAYALYGLAKRQGPDSPVWQLAAGGFHSATRIAASSPEMWTGICLSNREPISTALRALQANLTEALDALETGDADRLRTLLEQGWRGVVTIVGFPQSSVLNSPPASRVR